MAKKTSKRAKSPLERMPMRKLASGLKKELMEKLREKQEALEERKPKKP